MPKRAQTLPILGKFSPTPEPSDPLSANQQTNEFGYSQTAIILANELIDRKRRGLILKIKLIPDSDHHFFIDQTWCATLHKL